MAKTKKIRRGRGRALLQISTPPVVISRYNQRKKAHNKRIICTVGDQKNIWGAKRVAAKREQMTTIATALILPPKVRRLVLH
jgi:hypothetical protein